MGSNLKERVSDEIYEMKNLIGNFDYEKSKEKYLIIKGELSGLSKEKTIIDITSELLNKHVENKNILDFQTLIENIKPKDKLCYLLQLIYENELIKSIDKNNNIINFDSRLNSKIKIDNDNIELAKEELNILLENINKILNYVNFLRFKSIIYEKIAEKYFNLGTLEYSYFWRNRKDNIEELQKIIDLLSECVNYYQQTENQKIKLQEYLNYLDKVKAHKNVLIGKQNLKEEKYEEALKNFKNVNCGGSNLIEEKTQGIHLCYEKLSELEEEKKNYSKAIEYYELLNNNLKIYELEIRINENKIIENIKSKEFDKTLVHFKSIFESLQKVKEREFMELKFSNLFLIFMELIIKLAIISYRQKSLELYIKTLNNLQDIIENNDISTKLKELLSELYELEKDDKNLYFEHIKSALNSDTSEIKQRFYLSFLIIKFLKEQPPETLTILLTRGVKLSYLTSESFEVIKDYFINNDDLNYLLLISKLFYKIIVGIGIFNRIDNLNIIGEKIKKLIKEEETSIKYDIIEYLILSFQEIVINNNKILKYSGPKKLLFSVIEKYDKLIIYLSKSLLFLSTKQIKFDKKENNIIINYLKTTENENDNLLQAMIIQWELEPKFVSENIESIYKILMNYQKIKSKNIERLFNFLLSLSEELICSRDSILYLEEYINEKEENIHPLIYKLLKRIPIKFRSIKLNEKLSNYNSKDNVKHFNMKINDIKNKYKMMSTISKDNLPELESNLDDQSCVNQLMYYLKNQKYLLNYLNLVEISKHFSSNSKELFNLLIENEVKFNETALTNLLKGFYKNSEKEINLTLEIFNKIKQYHDKFPFIIEVNLKIEEFLDKKLYTKHKTFDIKLDEIFNDFSYLNGFSLQHNQFISYLLIISLPDKKQEIFDKMLIFLIEKHYDIGKEIYKEILKNISFDKFVDIISTIFSIKKISNEIKEITKEKLFVMLKESNNNAKLINTFKMFVDFIIIPNDILDYLISLLNGETDKKIYNEIMYFLCNYFSIEKKQDKQDNYFNSINKIASKSELYKFILDNINQLKSKYEILYLYGCLNYISFNDFTQEEKNILKIPINNIVDIMEDLNNNLDRNLFFENLAYLNKYYKYNDFSPKRDKILRRLYFNNKKNSLNKIKLICC